jgi:hypothetical protein
MNTKLITAWNNLQSMIQNHLDTYGVNSNTITENEELIKLIKLYWDISFTEIINKNKIDFTFSHLLNEINETYKKVEPTEALAIDYRLPDWLDQSIRVKENGELRFNAYKNKLGGRGLGDVVNQIDADTYKILNSCHDPRDTKREWDRRGLVYGHVQSGKTANYVGLINRAFDHGYKIVIVLTGVTEDLRQQTQKRINDGVLSFRNKNSKSKIFSPTTITDDLSKKFNNQLLVNYTTNENSIWVIKKNKTVLENLIIWLDKQRKNQDSERIKDTPILMIDDEADNASIQSLSKKEFEKWDEAIDLDYTNDELTDEDQEKLDNARESIIKAINRNIRVALSLMHNKTFVAYTATPYSVINQSYEDFTREVKIDGQTFKMDSGDLFPKDFIIPIKPGKRYIGINRLYNSDKSLNLPVLVNLSNNYPEDLNDIFPSQRGHDYFFEEIPSSLKDAIEHFILVIILKRHRGIGGYNSMLIHTSHLTLKTDYVATKVDSYCKNLMNELRINDSNIVNRFNKKLKAIENNSKDPLFTKYFKINNDFPIIIRKEDLTDVLFGKDFEIVSYHSSNDPMLQHKNHNLSYEDDVNFKNFIVIGGNRLSRGLTLEGLSVSYFVRNSTRKDSLYQMARWFGYRQGFEDLIRIYMPNDHILWYNSIFKLEEGLRSDFEENNDPDNPVMPKNAIIKIALETDQGLHLTPLQRKKFPSICDPNKLRKTKQESVKLHGGFSTKKVDANPKIIQNNFDLVVKLFDGLINNHGKNLFDNKKIPKDVSASNSKNISFTNISSTEIFKFLNKFSFHEEDYDMNTLREYIYSNSSKVNNWSVSLVNRKKDKEPYRDWDISKFTKGSGEEYLNLSKRTPNKEKSNNHTFKFDSILDRATVDTSFDLIDEGNIQKFMDNPTENKIQPLRNEKKIPLLLIYPVKIENHFLALLYIFYPFYNNSKSIKYIFKKSYTAR